MEQIEHKITPKLWQIFMFVSLSQQAEGWAYMLKDQFNFRTKQVLNTYLNSAKSLMGELTKDRQLELDDLMDESAIWSEMMQMMRELPLHKQVALYSAMKEFLNGGIKIQDEDGNLVHTTSESPEQEPSNL